MPPKLRKQLAELGFDLRVREIVAQEPDETPQVDSYGLGICGAADVILGLVPRINLSQAPE